MSPLDDLNNIFNPDRNGVGDFFKNDVKSFVTGHLTLYNFPPEGGFFTYKMSGKKYLKRQNPKIKNLLIKN